MITFHIEARPSSVFYPMLCELQVFPFWLLATALLLVLCEQSQLFPLILLDVFSPGFKQFPHIPRQSEPDPYALVWRGARCACEVKKQVAEQDKSYDPFLGGEKNSGSGCVCKYVCINMQLMYDCRCTGKKVEKRYSPNC